MMRRSLLFSFSLITLLLAAFASQVDADADNILFFDGWENGRIPYGQPGSIWKPVRVNNSQIVQTPVRAGKHAIKFTLEYADAWAHPASELRLDAPAAVNNFRLGQTYWYGFSIYIPDATVNNYSEIVNQFHALPDKDLGEDWRNPPFYLGLNGDRWQIMIRADADAVTGKGGYDVNRAWDLGQWQAGRWTDWVYQIKWSYEADGLVRVWKDGELVLDYRGPNTFNDRTGPYWKIGIYEWAWRSGPTAVSRRTLYYDEIRIGNVKASYADVAPRQQSQPLPPPAVSERATIGLQALYTFTEGGGLTVHDVSGVGSPLNLAIQDKTAVRWRPDGLSLQLPTLLRSTQPATKIQNACQASNALTLEAWITPANVTQDGPTRIMTMSANPYRRNFMLGQGLWGRQASNRFDVRLRTTETDKNGQPSLSTDVGSARPALTHLVYTRRADGYVTVYLNGQLHRVGERDGRFTQWETYPLALGNELSGDRPWLGTYHLVAVYCRALDSDEAAHNYAAGHRVP